MAAANGGNTELTVTDEVVVTENGVTIIGYTDLAGRLAAQTSQLYGTNIVNLLKLMTPEKDGELVLDLEDVIVRGITVAKGGESMWPPPPVQVSAAPAAARPRRLRRRRRRSRRCPPSPRSAWCWPRSRSSAWSTRPRPSRSRGTSPTLMLSIVIGYYVIGKVAHALHTPLMSVTNAISGVVVVGALVQINTEDTAILVLSTIAILLASINIFGGFAVTRRMLSMFSKGS